MRRRAGGARRASATSSGWRPRRRRPTTGPACVRASSAACAPRRTSRGGRASARCSTTCTSSGSAWRRRPPPSCAERSRSARSTSPRPSGTTRWRRVIAVMAAPSGSDLNPVGSTAATVPERAPGRRACSATLESTGWPMACPKTTRCWRCRAVVTREGRVSESGARERAHRARSSSILARSRRPARSRPARRLADRREPRLAARAHDGQGQEPILIR